MPRPGGGSNEVKGRAPLEWERPPRPLVVGVVRSKAALRLSGSGSGRPARWWWEW